MIFHIVAIAENRVIGSKNQLPWHFSEDLKNFKRITTGHPIIMGRATFESIGRPLPHRENIIISKNWRQAPEGCVLVHSPEEALAKIDNRDAFIIGGASIYESTLPLIDGIHLTVIHASYPGDAFYPELPAGFTETSSQVLKEEPLIEYKVLLKNR